MRSLDTREETGTTDIRLRIAYVGAVVVLPIVGGLERIARETA